MIYSSESDEEASQDLVVSDRKNNFSLNGSSIFEEKSRSIRLRNILKEYEDKPLGKM